LSTVVDFFAAKRSSVI